MSPWPGDPGQGHGRRWDPSPHHLVGRSVLVGLIQVALAIVWLHQAPQFSVQCNVGHVVRCEDQQVQGILSPADLLLRNRGRMGAKSLWALPTPSWSFRQGTGPSPGDMVSVGGTPPCTGDTVKPWRGTRRTQKRHSLDEGTLNAWTQISQAWLTQAHVPGTVPAAHHTPPCPFQFTPGAASPSSLTCYSFPRTAFLPTLTTHLGWLACLRRHGSQHLSSQIRRNRSE